MGLFLDVTRELAPTQAWETLMSSPKSTFTEGNYRSFFGMAIDMLVKPWEKMLGIMKFSEVSIRQRDRQGAEQRTHIL